jgi:3-phenylpropionate/trans-cinnamate dioxygenase ferredoxin reductase subunit
MAKFYDVLIVGGGHAGAQVAIALRQLKFPGTIALVGEEAELPYERPPLSKDYLSGQKSFERMLIRQRGYWIEHHVEMLIARRVTQVEPRSSKVTTHDGESLSYGILVWAAGGHPRRLSCSGHNLAGVHSVRTCFDADRIIDELPFTTQVVVVGAGYVGLEAAAMLSKLGKRVTVLEALDRVLARVTGETLSRFYEAEHRAHGVDVQLGTAVERVDEKSGRTSGVRLVGGKVIPAEMVIVGIGIVPAVEPLIAAGAVGGNGVAVDEYGHTSLPHVFAVGDCAIHSNAFAEGKPIRLESVQNANDMATTVARTISGEPTAYHAVPWFWSNQYDLRLQTVGLSNGHDQEVVRGNPATRSFSLIYLKKGRVIALDCVNATKDYVQGRALVLSNADPSAALLADMTVPLKNLTPA